ncbi:MAG: cytochrome c3 family protein, partial [Actinomycetota bacterium]
TGGTTLASPATITIKVNGNLTPYSRIQYFDGKDWQYVAGGTYGIDLQNNTISYDRITHFSYYTVTNPSNTSTPQAPATVTATAGVQPNINISWSAVGYDTLGNVEEISGYIVYRWVYVPGTTPTADKGTVDAMFLPGNTTSYTDSTGIPGETYYYGVSAENTGGIEGAITLQDGTNPTVTVAGSEKPHNAYSTNSNMCRDCHETHGPKGAQLLERKTKESEVCYTCHDGTGSTTNVKGEFAYTPRHPVDEPPTSPRDTGLACRDCHSPHVLDTPRHTAPGNVASNALKGTWGVEPNPWPVPKVQPRNIPAFPGLATTLAPLGAGVNIAKAGSYFYAVSGGAAVRFWRYNPSNNAWQLLKDASAAFGDGAALAYTGGDYIYATRGAATTAFWRYQISADVTGGTPWTTMTVFGGGAGVAVGAGGALVWTAGGAYIDYIYGLRGGTTNGFYRYSISGNSWTAMATTPANVGAGGSLVYPGSGDYIYATLGGDTATFKAYSITNNNWTTFDPADPTGFTIGTNSGNRLVYDGSAYIYALRGSTNGEFWRYKISTDLWNDGQDVPSAWTVVKPLQTEYQLCLKCHSNYYPSPVGYQPSNQINLAGYINPMNVSTHPIVGPGANRYNDIDTMEPPWNQQSNGSTAVPFVPPLSQRHDLMYCSDCHGSHLNDLPSETNTPTDPLGPHGSNQSKILRATMASDATNGTPLCDICHKKTIYWTGTYTAGPSASRFSEHGQNRSAHKVAAGCLTCHMGGSGVTDGKPTYYRKYIHGSNEVAVVDTTNRGPAHAFLTGDGIKYIRQADMSCWTVGTGAYSACAGQHAPRAPDAVLP